MRPLHLDPLRLNLPGGKNLGPLLKVSRFSELHSLHHTKFEGATPPKTNMEQWNPEMMIWKMCFLFWVILRFHVKFRGSKGIRDASKPALGSPGYKSSTNPTATATDATAKRLARRSVRPCSQ